MFILMISIMTIPNRIQKDGDINDGMMTGLSPIPQTERRALPCLISRSDTARPTVGSPSAIVIAAEDVFVIFHNIHYINIFNGSETCVGVDLIDSGPHTLPDRHIREQFGYHTHIGER